nr:MAG TPA: hypothetical protein [Bacteriophage sp.]
MTLDRIHKYYDTTYFCQVSKWGRDLNEEEAIKLGLLPAPPVKTPVKRVTRKKVSEPINTKGIEPNTKEVIE